MSYVFFVSNVSIKIILSELSLKTPTYSSLFEYYALLFSKQKIIKILSEFFKILYGTLGLNDQPSPFEKHDVFQ